LNRSFELDQGRHGREEFDYSSFFELMEITDEPSEIVARPGSGDPFLAMRREMENVFRAFDQGSSSSNIGAGAPAISVAETNDSFEVTAELPGVDEKDINVRP